MPTSHDGITKAREAAEALFRPRTDAETRPAPGETPMTEKQQSIRKPRILVAASAVPERDREPGAPADPASQARRATVKKAAKVPASKYGRIRALATYGMTVEQVAEIYGVPVNEIERIVS